MKPAMDAAGHRTIKEEPGTLIWSEPLAADARAVVKMYRHRPLHEPLRRLFVPYRTEREYRILALLSRQGVACPEPLSWSHGRDRTNGLHELLTTRKILNAMPLTELLGREGGLRLDLAPLFALARRMHECGVAHGAFYPRNVLVTAADGPQPSFHLIDFAHGRSFRGSIVGTRPARYDLLDMLRMISFQEPPVEAPHWLESYGLRSAEAVALLERLPRHRIQRPWRHFRRIAVDAIAIRNALGLRA